MDKTYTITKNGAFFAQLPKGARHHATLAVLAGIAPEAVTPNENGILTATAKNGTVFQILDAQRAVMLRKADGTFRTLAILPDDETAAGMWSDNFGAALAKDGAAVFAVRIVRNRIEVAAGDENAAALVAFHKARAAEFVAKQKANLDKSAVELGKAAAEIEAHEGVTVAALAG